MKGIFRKVVLPLVSCILLAVFLTGCSPTTHVFLIDGYSEGVAFVKKTESSKWACYDTKGHKLFSLDESPITCFKNGVAIVGGDKIINEKGKVVSSTKSGKYSHILLDYTKDGFWGYTFVSNDDGTEVGIIDPKGNWYVEMSSAFYEQSKNFKYIGQGLYQLTDKDDVYYNLLENKFVEGYDNISYLLGNNDDEKKLDKLKSHLSEYNVLNEPFFDSDGYATIIAQTNSGINGLDAMLYFRMDEDGNLQFEPYSIYLSAVNLGFRHGFPRRFQSVGKLSQGLIRVSFDDWTQFFDTEGKSQYLFVDQDYLSVSDFDDSGIAQISVMVPDGFWSIAGQNWKPRTICINTNFDEITFN